jgi:hypothetical protein
MTGLITGIAAALSMAASEYLSTKAGETSKSAGKAALYTGGMYLAAVIVLVLPFINHPAKRAHQPGCGSFQLRRWDGLEALLHGRTLSSNRLPQCLL